MAGNVARLTPRQRECLYLVHEGYSQKAIATTLGLSLDMVKEHLEAARRTLGVEKSLRAARILVDEEGVPSSVGGIKMGVATTPPPPSFPPSSDLMDDAEGPPIDTVGEAPAVYQPPASHLPSRTFPWPFPGRGRGANDVSIHIKLIQIGVCAVLLGALGMLALGIIGGTRQVLIHIFLE